MFDITILKGAHAGSDAARKLVPYVKKCDLFCPESGGEKAAWEKERQWETVLKSWSRTQLKKELEKTAQGSEEVKQFTLGMFDNIFREQKRILYLERDSVNAIDNHLYLQSTQVIGLGLSQLRNRNPTAYEVIYRGMQERKQYVQSRDRAMAATLNNLDAIISSRYPDLGRPLNIVVQIGYGHHIESFTTVPVTVVQFDTTPAIINVWLDKVYSGASLEEMRPEFDKFNR